MTRQWFSSRARAAFLLCALLFGPIGPGGAWHVARVDESGASASSAVHVGDPANTASQSGHQGPACPICQLLHGLRGVVSPSGVLVVAAPTLVPDTSEFDATPRTGQRMPCAGRAPPAA